MRPEGSMSQASPTCVDQKSQRSHIAKYVTRFLVYPRMFFAFELTETPLKINYEPSKTISHGLEYVTALRLLPYG